MSVARAAMLTLLLAVPAALAPAAAGQPGSPDQGASAALIDPDCDPQTARDADPSQVEDADGVCLIDPDCDPQRARDADPSLVEASDGVCPTSAAQPPAEPKGQRSDAPSVEGGENQRPGGHKRKLRSKNPQSREPTGGAKPGPDRKGKRKSRRRTPRRNPAPSPVPTTPAVDSLPHPHAHGAHDSASRESRVPRFLLPIYRAAGLRYGIRWEVLAAINEIESDYGRNLNVSSAGAMGWMQFMPSSWRAYGVDRNGDGVKDPYDPVDAIFAAARYLRAAGYEHDVRGAIYAYNHAWWYVHSVMRRARQIAADHLSPPRVRRLDPRFASRLARIADRSGVPWELMLAVLRLRGKYRSVPATRAQLRALARRVAALDRGSVPAGTRTARSAASRWRRTSRPRSGHDCSLTRRGSSSAWSRSRSTTGPSA
jgi:hypothetical protein